MSAELASHLASLSREIGRQVGVLINRRGQIEHTFVGDANRIYIPDIGRHRAGAGHFRGLRHIHTVLNDGGLQPEDYSDLTKLRLDLIGCLAVSEDGEPGKLTISHLLPSANRRALKTPRHQDEVYPSVYEATVNFKALIDDLEKEFGKELQTRATAGHLVPGILVGVYPDRSTAASRIEEMQELAGTAGVAISETIVQLRNQVHSRFVVGRGKLEEVVLRCLDLDSELVIFDHNLTPAQARAIAAFSELKVIDRTQLILDIFAQHAQSRDGKLQVELAQLKYNLPRLTDLDAGLSRLTGGIGGRGPGETKLEINRRRARDRVTKLEREISRLSNRRELRRSKRQTSGQPIVSIVGYTNAGKSTLLNILTSSEVGVADQLFATLDPTSRRLRFPREREAIITDTVGFIRDLPPDLIRAFRATLEELEGADLLLHVVDISDPKREEKMKVVHDLLKELSLAEIPELIVYNKCDKLEPFEVTALCRKQNAIPVSATAKTGLKELIEKISETLWQYRSLTQPEPWEVQESGETSEVP